MRYLEDKRIRKERFFDQVIVKVHMTSVLRMDMFLPYNVEFKCKIRLTSI